MFGNICSERRANGKDSPKTDCGKFDAAPAHRCSDWHGLIESSGAREKNFDVLGFRILTVTGGSADQSWWIT